MTVTELIEKLKEFPQEATVECVPAAHWAEYGAEAPDPEWIEEDGTVML